MGNVIGQTVSLTGTNLSNGITKSNTYTPVVGNPPQVISLAPASTGLNMSIPATLGGYSLSQAKVTGSATTPERNYVPGGTGANQDLVTPQLLLATLPANLQPNTTLFYYDPQSENAALQTQALKETGQATFINGLSLDSQQQLSVTDQEKIVLYANAEEYAKANDIKLGQALTQPQINELTKPMLWYVEQTVPEPGCTATGTLSCPTVTALVPQVYLPANTSALSADGNIVASDSIKLNFGSAATGGSILNTGTISSNGSLTVNTGTLTNEANQVDVGQIWSKVKAGYVETTGTVVQPGGFMSAADTDLNVATLNQIGGALQKLNADGTVDQAATQQMLASLQQQLGGSFTQMALTDHLHTDFVKGGGGLPMFVVAALAIVASIVTAGAAAVAFGVAMTELSLGSVLIGALGGMVGSAVSQVASGQGFNFGQMLKAGAIGALSAGALGALHLADLASLRTVGSEIANGTVQMADLGSALVTIGERGLVTASVDTTVEGGSFGRAFEGSVIGDLGTVGASAIGAKAGDDSSWLAEKTPGNVLAHAALGCAMSAAAGTGCAGGAIGAGASAIASPYIRDALYDGTQTVTTTDNGNGTLTRTTSYNNQMINTLVTGIAALGGGLAAGLAGANGGAGATWAENEVLNNALGDHRTEEQKDEDELKKEMSQLDSHLPGHGKIIVGTNEDGEPEYAVKPPLSILGPIGATGSGKGAAGNTVRVGGGSAFEDDVGNGANDWSDGTPKTSSEVDPRKRTPILFEEEEVPSWASIGRRTRRSSGRRWWSW